MWQPFVGMFLAIVASVLFFLMMYIAAILLVKGGFLAYEKLLEEIQKQSVKNAEKQDNNNIFKKNT